MGDKQKTIIRIEEPLLTPEQEQAKWLGEATRNVQEKAAAMNMHIREGQYVNVLRSASQMLSELRTGMLNPSTYYELYCRVFDELQPLEMFFYEEVEKGRKVEDIYEVVQHAGNIIPRLYMLITVGCVYIKTGQAPVKEILKDLIEMCKGVQHPTRGLFLRHHLLSMVKSKLPDADSEIPEEDGCVTDSVDFILQNFKEMDWLWVRMEAKSNAAKNIPKRKDQERKELRILVGYNIVRLSQLEGISKGGYKEHILPKILEIILMYKEPLAQQYLFEVIIQVFPDEFHLHTLKVLLESFSKVCPKVDITAILAALMERLGNYVAGQREGLTEGSNSKKENRIIAEMFDILGASINEIASTTTLLSGAAFVEAQVALMKLAIKTYPEEYERVDLVLGSITEHFSAAPLDDESTKALNRALKHLMDEFKNPNILLDLTKFEALTYLLPFRARRDAAIALSTMAANSDTKIDSMERVGTLFNVIAPIVRFISDTPADSTQIYADEDEFLEEQSLVCRVLHTVDSTDLAQLMKMYSGIRKQIGHGGNERMKHTLKAMAFLYIRAGLRIYKQTAQGEEVKVDISKPFSYLHDPDGKGKGVLDVLSADNPSDCFPIYLAAANAADVCEVFDMSYELFVRAFTIFEENAANPKEQARMMSTMISALIATRNLPEDSYETLATKVCQYTATFLQKHDQAMMASLCANLFWKKNLSEGFHTRVMECLKRSVKLAGNSTAVNQPPAFVEVLNQFLHLFAANATGVDGKAVSTVVELMREANMNIGEDMRDTPEIEASKLYYRNTTRYIRSRAAQDERWQEIEL